MDLNDRFCAHCYSFPWELTYSPDKPQDYTNSPPIHTQSRSYKDLVEASLVCSICCVIEDGLHDEIKVAAKTDPNPLSRQILIDLGVTITYKISGGSRTLDVSRDDHTERYLPDLRKHYRASSISCSDAQRCLDTSLPEYRCSGPREIFPEVNYEFLRAWDRLCENHGAACLKAPKFLESGPVLEELRLVDVREKCLVTESLGAEYVALSYVWGDKAVGLGQLTTGQFDAMFRPGSLNGGFPPTITDTFELTEKLGYRLLFVDRLCIIQDDVSDRGLYVSHMDSIYARARLTVVAAGSEANGLPGLRGSLRTAKNVKRDKSFRTPDDVVIGQIEGPEIYNERTVEGWSQTTRWATRGWTFQEKILSSRMMIFTDDRVLWTCMAANYAEDMAFEFMSLERNLYFLNSKIAPPLERLPGQLDNMKSGRPELERRLAISKKYAELVNTYVKRNLTFPADILRAFQGVLNAFAKINKAWPTRFALSLVNLPLELLWGCEFFQTSLSDCQRRETSVSAPKQVFPSWSWLAWKTRACTPGTQLDVRFSCLSMKYALTGSFFCKRENGTLGLLFNEERDILAFNNNPPAQKCAAELHEEISGSLTEELLIQKALIFQAYVVSCAFCAGKHPKFFDDRNFHQDNDGCLEFGNEVIWRIPAPAFVKKWLQYPSSDCELKELSLIVLGYDGWDGWAGEGLHSIPVNNAMSRAFAALVSWVDGIAYREGLMCFPIQNLLEIEHLMSWDTVVFC